MAGSVSTALAGSMERLIPVDLATPGEKYYALVSQDNKLIGQIIVGVTEGSLSVNYRTSDPATVVKQAMFYFYPSAASMTLQDLNDPTKAYQFGQAIPTGGLTSCVISPRLIVNYDSDNPGNRIFNEAGLSTALHPLPHLKRPLKQNLPLLKQLLLKPHHLHSR